MLELTGAFKKDPQRRALREGEPEVASPLGDPPTVLDEAEQERWRELRRDVPWLNVTHRQVVELAVRLWMKMRKNTATAGELALLKSCWTDLGMTPSASSRVKVPPAKAKKNAFGELSA